MTQWTSPARRTRTLQIVCGVDEAGRGPLAGPVYAAAVVLNARRPIEGLRDSKLLSAPVRETLARAIRRRASAWAVASASVGEIDSLNILQASLLAMRRAVDSLGIEPTLARVDGNRAPTLRCAVETLVDGDALDPAISAASILAKCARDAEMVELHRHWPHYGFDRHKGYATEEHLAMLREHGPCIVHRRSFAPVRLLLGSERRPETGQLFAPDPLCGLDPLFDLDRPSDPERPSQPDRLSDPDRPSSSG